ncbi:MAG: beta-propeller fold lactonase family protein [Syntrophomonas sp.]
MSSVGMVYAMTNSAVRNKVIAFRRGINGKLIRIKAYATGGRGTGERIVDPLSSQGSLILSRNGRFLFAVNAGSNSISSFRVSSSGRLTLVDVDPSGGVRPNSLSNFGDLLYVSNVGNTTNNIASNVTGFRVRTNGRLARITGSTHALSTSTAQPSCIVFSRRGRLLVVSELNTNRLSVFRVNTNGTLSGPTINNSNGAGPFGSVFLTTGPLLVSEVGANALSSYTAFLNGNLRVISGSVPNGQQGTCWVSVSRHEHFAYTSNAGSGTITRFRIRSNGTLVFIKNVNSTLSGTGAPIDSGVSRDGRNLYVLNGNQGSISVFRIFSDGRLQRLQVLQNTGLPELGAQGLAVR